MVSSNGDYSIIIPLRQQPQAPLLMRVRAMRATNELFFGY